MNTTMQNSRTTREARRSTPVRVQPTTKPSNALTLMVALILLLALPAAGMGVFYGGSGAGPFEYTTARGDVVTISGRGLYRFDGADLSAQAMAQDAVTLLIGIPLLAASLWLYRRSSLRGTLLLAGTLGYFLYTYTSLVFGAGFNMLFLVYVALFSLSLFAFITAMVSVDLVALPSAFGDRLPRKTIAGFLFFCAAFLLLAWGARIVPALVNGSTPAGLSTSTTMFIQALDLGVIVPMMILAAVQLLRRRPFGYLLTSVALLKFVTMGLALDAMIVGQYLAGISMSAAEVAIFPIISLVSIAMAVIVLRAVRAQPAGE